jgi:hypothetical protein
VTVEVEDFQKFQGGRSAIRTALILGVLGLAGFAIALAKDPASAYQSYLIAFTYWAGVAIGSLLLLMIFHAFHAKWMTVLRRPIEAMASSMPIFVLLFIPVAVGLASGNLFPWTKPDQMHLTPEQYSLLVNHKAKYLNVPFFLVRTAIYFVVTIFLSQRLFGLSTRQDSTGEVELTVKQRRLSAGGLPFLAMVIAFASFDWLMSLTPFWFSTMFGVYYFAGIFLTTLSIVAILNARARGKDLYGDLVSPEHSHNVGKLMFAFTCFWTYIAFSQFMLIWIANLPEETPFFTLRMKETWRPVSIILIVCHFFIPFLILLSRKLKRQPSRLAVMAVWLVLVQLLDLYWLVVPTFSPDSISFPLALIPAWVGVGGIGTAFAIWRLRGHYTVPVRDPFLSVSLRYRQP